MAACNITLVLENAHSGLISSASLWLNPSTQGHIIIADGATVFIQHASCPAPETISLWEYPNLLALFLILFRHSLSKATGSNPPI